MPRIANERTILQIETIAQSGRPSLDAVMWTVGDAECRRERHRFAGQVYAFSIEVLDMRCSHKGRCHWHLLVVTELWQEAGRGGLDLRTSKWLKLLAGKPADIADWIRQRRPV